MNPSEKGWLRKYIDFRIALEPNAEYETFLNALVKNQSVEEFLYTVNQPTGLLYGFPVRFPFVSVPNSDEWNEKEKMKIILLESLLHVGIYFRYSKGLPLDEGAYNEIVNSLSLYYNTSYPQLGVPLLKIFPKQLEMCSTLERIIDKRTSMKSGLRLDMWTNLFHNSLLFLDVIYFAQWLGAEEESQEPIGRHNEQRRLNILKVIAAAAYSDNKIEKEEITLFEFFLKSAWLTRENEKAAREMLKSRIDINDIEFEIFDSWILRKFILELAILMVRSDHDIREAEIVFLNKLLVRINLADEEMETSLLAIDSFMVENWSNITYLKKRHNYGLISQNLSSRLSLMIKRNKKRLRQEIYESKELVELLVKSTKTELTKEEKEKVKSQLLDIMKTIPAFAIFMIPGGTVILPLLLKILPKNILYPSSFQD